MKIEMHAHCKPISACAHHSPEETVEALKNGGYDAVVLVNHCYPNHLVRLSDDPSEQAKEYVNAFLNAKKRGDEIGIKVFFGVELKLMNEPHRPEFLLYGITVEDFLNTFPLYDKTQEEIFELANKLDIVMVQAHPYRSEQGYAPADMRYVHGIEIFNPHPLFNPHVEECIKLADDNGIMIRTGGSDFHVSSQTGNAWMDVPDTIEDQLMLRDYLKECKSVIYSKDKVIYDNTKS